MFRFLLILLANFTLANPIYAKTVEQKDLHFKINTEALLKGEIHFSFALLPHKELMEKYPEAADLDSLSLLQARNVRYFLTKAVYLVDRPVGFFDHEHMNEKEFLDHIMGDQKVTKIGKSSFQIMVPGETAHSYFMNNYFDSDDISTLPNSRVIQGVTAAKKLDVISQSASSIIFKELSKFSKYAVGGTGVTSYVPLKEEKTLVITYGLLAIKKAYALENVLKSNFLRETRAVRSLVNDYGRSSTGH